MCVPFSELHPFSSTELHRSFVMFRHGDCNYAVNVNNMALPKHAEPKIIIEKYNFDGISSSHQKIINNDMFYFCVSTYTIQCDMLLCISFILLGYIYER